MKVAGIMIKKAIPLVTFLFVATLIRNIASATEHYQIRFIDEETGRGVPLVQIETVNGIKWVSDSDGNIAFGEPSLMGTEVFFFVKSHGYEIKADGFGYQGIRVTPKAGKSSVHKIKRINIAQRLYRVTGDGIFHDTKLLGLTPNSESRDARIPNLNGKVFGSDSVQSAVYKNKLVWFWGDTNRPKYPLGNFHVPGAFTGTNIDPEKTIPLQYYLADDGFAKETCKIPGEGPTWLDGLIVIKENKSEILLGKYVKVKNLLEIYERGLVQFDDKKREFRSVLKYDFQKPLFPIGHAFIHPKAKDDKKGAQQQYVYFCNPFPLVRVSANLNALKDQDQFESYSCFKTGSTGESVELDRDDQSKLIFKWRKRTVAPDYKIERELIKSGKLTGGERIFLTRDIDSDTPIDLAVGTTHWNEHRQKWITIATEVNGKSSMLGEVYYTESDSLTGPRKWAKKIVTHDNYSFYNPRHHPIFDRDNFVYFEGTYTTLFTKNQVKTPRYDYNQIMYKLDLDDPRLKLSK